MANVYTSMPLLLNVDMANWAAVSTALQAQPFGLRVWKIALNALTTTSAGTVTVTDSVSGISLLAPMVVAAGSTAGSALFFDNPTQLMTWPAKFAVTGLTATGTQLLVWYRV